MRSIFLLLALTAMSWAYWEPNDAACKCQGAGNGDVRSYDGVYRSIVASQKTLLSQWGFDGDTDATRNMNKCRFTLRCVTSTDINGGSGNLYIDWIAISFDKTKLKNSNARNLVFGQCPHIILERGRGVDGVKRHDISVMPYFYLEPSYQLYVFREMSGVMKLRTDSCQQAFNWLPLDRQTGFVLWLGEDYRDNSLIGLCGDCDGDNDNSRCDGQPLSSEDYIKEISDSCKDGKHQNVNISGASKFNCYS